jgi:hypothetical protein
MFKWAKRWRERTNGNRARLLKNHAAGAMLAFDPEGAGGPEDQLMQVTVKLVHRHSPPPLLKLCLTFCFAVSGPASQKRLFRAT